MPNILWKFIDDYGTFIAKNPHTLSRLYFPLANEAGIMCSITPNLHGDIKIDQHSFLTIPSATEDLLNSRYNRNFWIHSDKAGAWSFAFGEADESIVEAGCLWHKSVKLNKKIGIKMGVLNFVPVDNSTVEIMYVEITNISKKRLRLTPTAAIPIYGRSLDRLRDHRHVTSLLNRVKVNKFGVIMSPTMSFDERGHLINTTSYFVLGCEANQNQPLGSFPTMLEFTGEGNSLERPDSVIKNKWPIKASSLAMQGKEAMGTIRFKTISLLPDKSSKYIIVMGITKDEAPIKIFSRFNSSKKVKHALSLNKKFWAQKINAVYFSSDDKNFNRWMRWISLQPSLRKIFGCSFLPDFDYGRGGKGWRDLWQDCLTLILINPHDIRGVLINNFCGVKTDGSNATIIGKKQGEFIPDRNNISRIWMDHGLWPFITLNLYINQTGDTDILFEKVPYFQSSRVNSVLKHVFLQHERPFSKIGRHGNFLLEGADWNDGLDMAKENGESVAFTAAYAGNLMDIANLLEKIKYKTEAIDGLRKKAIRLSEHIRKNEWITLKSGFSFFNGYYDNAGNRVEGDHKNGVRMTLTGQVLPIISNVAADSQVREIYKSAKKYLWDNRLKGFRLNTDFKEIQPNLGRAFAFTYGEKENGAFFSHMNVMFAYGLYKRNFVREGYEVLSSLYNMCLNTSLSKIYPGIPEYFNSDGRGMYHYLTGSASWLLLTMLTQVFGIRGDMGKLVISPKLVKEQFGASKKVSVNTNFMARKICVTYFNPKGLDFGEYKAGEILFNDNPVQETPIDKELFLKLAKKPINAINVYLAPSYTC